MVLTYHDGRPMPGISTQEFEQLPSSGPRLIASPSYMYCGSSRINYLAITTVVQELLSLGKSRFAAIRIPSRGRSPRMIGQ
jgi:hypothetical protein